MNMRTATEAMKIDTQANRLAARDRAVAISVGQQMVDRHYNPDRIENMRDVRIQIARAAEDAAYEAIQKERALHAEDMRLLQAWYDIRWAEHVTRAPQMTILPDPPSQPKKEKG